MSAGCENAVEYLYQYLDSEITWFKKMRITRHLSNCDPCMGAFDFETRLKQVIRERSREEPPPELMEHLRALLEREHEADEAEA